MTDKIALPGGTEGVTATWGRSPGHDALSLVVADFDSAVFNKDAVESFLSERDHADIAMESGVDGDVFVKISETFAGLATDKKDLGVDRANHVIRGCLMCGLESVNGRRYHKALSHPEAPSLYEGCYVNSNHVEAGKAVSWGDRLGQYENCRFVEGKGMVGDLHYNPRHGDIESLLWWAENRPGAIANSHRVNAIGRKGEDGKFDVHEIKKVFSTDIVADGGTARTMFEHDQHDEPGDSGTKPKSKGDEMEIKELTLETLRTARPDLIEGLVEEAKADKEYRDLIAERDQLKTDLEEAKKKLAEHDEAKKKADELAKLKEQAVEALGEDAEVSELFLKTLLPLSAEERAEAIEERKKLTEGKTPSKVKSKSKSVKEQAGGGGGDDHEKITDAKSFSEAARAGTR